MENERYLESKMVTNGFGSYLDLTSKSFECITKPDVACIKIYETAAMKSSNESSTNEAAAKSNSSVRILNQTHNQLAFY